MERTHSLTSFSDDDLLRRLSDLLGRSRRDEADLVAHIGEVDRRRLYAREASPSMFAYCTEVLHLSEAEAYLRIAAARASREHPLLLTMLADGRLHLTAIAKLAPHLTLENREALLKRAAHKSRREIEELVAELSPRPDAPAVMRKLPDRRDGTFPPPLRLGPGTETLSLGRRPEGGASVDRQRRPDGVAARERLPSAFPGENAVMKNLVVRFIREDQGQDLIEYAFLAVFIGLAVTLGLQAVATGVNTQMSNIGTQVTGS